MGDETQRSQHLQRALNGLRQLSTSLRSVSGSLGTTSRAAHGRASHGSGGDSAAVADHEEHSRSGSRCSDYNIQVIQALRIHPRTALKARGRLHEELWNE